MPVWVTWSFTKIFFGIDTFTQVGVLGILYNTAVTEQASVGLSG